MSIGTILLIILIVMLVGAVPAVILPVGINPLLRNLLVVPYVHYRRSRYLHDFSWIHQSVALPSGYISRLGQELK